MAAASKYQLTRLRQMCEDTLAWSVTADNAVGLLRTADMLDAEVLKKRCVDTVTEKFTTIAATPEYAALATEAPALMLVVSRSFAASVASAAAGGAGKPPAKRQRTS